MAYILAKWEHATGCPSTLTVNERDVVNFETENSQTVLFVTEEGMGRHLLATAEHCSCHFLKYS